jgi:large subunit ribosomal protein L17
MAKYRKLGRTSSQRKALLRNQVTNLLWYGRIETTEARAKEVRSVAEKMITLAVREYDKTVDVQKKFHNDKGQIVETTVTNDLPEKLHARRLMMAYLYDVQEAKKDDESKAEYKERTKDNKHPVVEKLFREYGPKYRARNQEKNCAGGYTRIYKLGPRRGDAAEMVIIELV